MRLTRRQWLKQSSGTARIAAAGIIAGGFSSIGMHGLAQAQQFGGPARPWEIGCFNRPWNKWTYDEALDGMKAAGYRLTGLVGDHKGERPFLGPDATSDYLDKLKERINARGLIAITAWYPTSHNIPLEQSIERSRKSIDNAQRLGLKSLISGAVTAPAQYDHYYKVMADAAAYAQDKGIQIVVKPHDGCAASAEELLVTLEKVNHPNFRIWYDAGNIIHYTGKDPNADVERVAKSVTGFCAKDCAARRGDVMLQFGEGKVDFAGVFSRLKRAGYEGPVMVECCGGKTPDEVTAAARANREFLERVIRTV